jgi:histone-lysine N-methyltransferase SETD1
MSRASGASFAQFFPSAPRAAKDKAKEREKFKTQISGSPRPPADVNSIQSGFRVENAGFSRFGGDNTTDSAPPITEDNESIQGDILNGVGSASSHSSTISSVFSATAQPTNMSSATSRNVSSLTPMTTTDSSPNRIASPNQYKTSAQATNATGFEANNSIPHNDILQAEPTVANHMFQEPRVYARDPSRGIKGSICTYDPLLDKMISSRDRKNARAIYKEFGLVRTHIHNLPGSVIFAV